MNFAAARVAIFAALLLPAYCKLLLVELEDDGGGDAAALRSPGASQRRKAMKGGYGVIIKAVLKLATFLNLRHPESRFSGVPDGPPDRRHRHVWPVRRLHHPGRPRRHHGRAQRGQQGRPNRYEERETLDEPLEPTI